jgi:hypothetical protein
MVNMYKVEITCVTVNEYDFENLYLPSDQEIVEYLENYSTHPDYQTNTESDKTTMTRLSQLFAMMFQETRQETRIYDAKIVEIDQTQELQKYEQDIPEIKEITIACTIHTTLSEKEIFKTIANYVPTTGDIHQSGDDPWAYPADLNYPWVQPQRAHFYLRIDGEIVVNPMGTINEKSNKNKVNDKATKDKAKKEKATDKDKAKKEKATDKAIESIATESISPNTIELLDIQTKNKSDLQVLARYLCIPYYYKLNKINLKAAILKTKGKQSSTRVLTKNGCVNKKKKK